MKFFLGLGFGALGMWAYQGGKLQSLLNGAPEPVQDMVQKASAPQIARPTAAEVAGRPSEPLPRYEPEGVHVQND